MAARTKKTQTHKKTTKKKAAKTASKKKKTTKKVAALKKKTATKKTVKKADSVPAKKDAEESLSEKKTYIVGIGASAGGLEALEEFFTNMPADSNMAFVVVQHLSPDYKSLMAELLSRHTRMPVVEAEDGHVVEPNAVYLIPRKKNMTIFHGRLLLIEQAGTHNVTLNLPIDIFLRSLAEDQGEKAIAIILSGTGTDGTRGIRAVKEAGGMVMVQDISNAKFDGMPNSAISTRLADYILPAHAMSEALLNFIKHPYAMKNKTEERGFISDEDSISKIFSLIRTAKGVDFTYYKPSTVVRRIERRMSINQMRDIEEYARYMAKYPAEVNSIFKEFLISVTKFFRDDESFATVREKIIPEIFKAKENDESIRVWVAGCATGEEAYSLAILFEEYMKANKRRNDVKIFATDIDKEAIETASTGVFSESIAADVSLERLKTFFIKRGDTYEISREIREMVIFASHNLIKDPPFSKIDMVSCRNLLIYLQPVLQKKVLTVFSFSLNENGFLVLGTSETIGDLGSYYRSIDVKNKIYRFRGGRRPDISMTFDAHEMRSRMPQLRNDYTISAQKHQIMPRGMEAVYDALMRQYVPPTAVVDETKRVVHVVGDVNPYIKIPQGRMDFDIAQMARDEISIALGTALQNVKKTRKQMIYKDIKLKDGQTVHKIDLTIRPVERTRTAEMLIFISFIEKSVEHDAELSSEEFDIDSKAEQRIQDLEQELQYTRENLQATIEELETSNEELQATNEELIASNEELQSTNEELQSVNEELITVNSEHQMKIQELTEMTNDMENFLHTSDMGVVFLDKDLHIRKFTPSATKEIHLIDSDIGRPISDISHRIRHENLLEDARSVLENLTPIEMEVQNEDNVWFLLKIVPYRTVDRIIKGIVITLLNIDTVKRMTENLRMLSTADEESPSMIVTADAQGHIDYVNRRFTDYTGHRFHDVRGKKLDGLCAEESCNVCDDMWCALTNGNVWHGEMQIQTTFERTLIEEATIIPLRNDEGKIVRFFKIAHDITERRKAEERLYREQERIAGIMDTSPIGITIVNIKGQIVFANRRAEEILHLKKEEITARNYDTPDWKSTDENGRLIPQDEYPFSLVCKSKKPLYGMEHYVENQKGERVKLRINGAPVLDDDKAVKEVVFSIEQIE